jgi:hypothetical protein
VNVSWNSTSRMRYGPKAIARTARDTPFVPPQPHHPEAGAHQNDCRERPSGPRRDKRVVQSVGDIAGAVACPEHLDIAQILGALVEQRMPVAARAAVSITSGIAHTSTPPRNAATGA